jgi:Penicillin binding protein transpeptidase domain
VADDPAKPGYANIAEATPEKVYTTEVKPNGGLLDTAPLLSIIPGLTCVVLFVQDAPCRLVNSHRPTAQNTFKGFPHSDLPIAGKTGTAQGLNQAPENDSSVFVGFQTGEKGQQGYTIGAYLEKAGYGKRAAAPVVRCLMLAVNGMYEIDTPELSDELNVLSPYAAPPNHMPDEQCLNDAAAADERDRGER